MTKKLLKIEKLKKIKKMWIDKSGLFLPLEYRNGGRYSLYIGWLTPPPQTINPKNPSQWCYDMIENMILNYELYSKKDMLKLMFPAMYLKLTITPDGKHLLVENDEWYDKMIKEIEKYDKKTS